MLLISLIMPRKLEINEEKCNFCPVLLNYVFRHIFLRLQLTYDRHKRKRSYIHYLTDLYPSAYAPIPITHRTYSRTKLVCENTECSRDVTLWRLPNRRDAICFCM